MFLNAAKDWAPVWCVDARRKWKEAEEEPMKKRRCVIVYNSEDE